LACLPRAAAVLLAGLFLAAPAFAQLPPPPRGLLPRPDATMPGPMIGAAPGADLPGADPLQLLVNSYEVQRDLGLNQHQLENLQLASRNFLTQMQDAMRPGSPPEQVRAAIDAQMAKTRPLIARELTPEQLARLQQIMLQIQGPCTAASDTQEASQLGLSPQTQSQVAAVCQQRGEEMRASFRPPAPGENHCEAAARNRDQLTRIRADGDARALALFTPEQRAQFTLMEGRPLNLPPPMPPDCAPGRPPGRF